MSQYVSLAKLMSMSDEELRALSMKKNQRGCATVEALKAQREMIRRNGGDAVAGHHFDGRRHLSDEKLGYE